MKILYIPVFFLFPIFGFSQMEVYFKYDDAGNQRYRGTNPQGRQAVPEEPKEEINTQVSADQNSSDVFWSHVRVYPVPVRDVLTIDWNDEVDDLIDEISLYEHNAVHWKFQQKNLPILNKKIQIDMTSYYMGVYVLRFTLKDGNVMTRNITKF